MPRVIWKGAISFSLIHIPVALYPASRENTLDLDLLDRRDFSPVGYQRINKSTGKALDWDDIVKGYEYKKGEYVVLTDEDFRRANVEATQTIDIEGFVSADAIPPYYFETPYYLAPQKRGEKVYVLLREALVRTQQAALGRVVVRTRQYACALMPVGETLMLNTLRYADEILPAEAHAPEKTTLKSVGVTPQELAMAVKLVRDMSRDWNPEQHHDTYREDLLKLIASKVKQGRTHALTEAAETPAPRRTAEIVDLTALLKRSLESRRAGDSAARTASRTAARRKPAPARRRQRRRA